MKLQLKIFIFYVNVNAVNYLLFFLNRLTEYGNIYLSNIVSEKLVFRLENWLIDNKNNLETFLKNTGSYLQIIFTDSIKHTQLRALTLT